MKLDIDQADLRPLVSAVALSPERLAYPEGEAASLIGLPKHVLRDCRLRGEIRGRLVGKKIVYERGELLRYLSASK